MPRHAAIKGGMLPPGIPPIAAAGVHALQGDMVQVHVLPEPIQASPEVPANRLIRTVIPAPAGLEAIIQEGPDPQVQEIYTAGPEGPTGVQALPGLMAPLRGPPDP